MSIFYTICFSLKSAKENLYVYCLLMMYASLKKKGVLQPDDHFLVMCDIDTAQVLRTIAALKDVKYLIMSHAKDCYDGMRWKYMLPDLIELPDNVTITYMDVDFLALKPFQSYLPPDYVCVFAEGKANDSNYCGEENTHLSYDPSRKGMTAGFFQYKLGPKTRAFFKRILKDMEAPKKHYTLDQVYFNQQLYNPDTKFVEHNSNFISFNGHNNMPGATLMNCAGEPGNDQLHFSKQLQFYLALM